MTVFTNGVFSLLHVGHVRLLQFAREQGDWLIVAINGDESATVVKHRHPVMTAMERREILLALECVDQVEIYDEYTPTKIIERLRPDVLVKGPECRNTEIPGAAAVLSWGGRVAIPDWPIEHSVSGFIERMRK
jgi:rfaE bifunctional protein nucleotidyltransferase chain/domain